MKHNSQLKVPLNMDRDNITPSYLRVLRAAVQISRVVRPRKENAVATKKTNKEVTMNSYKNRIRTYRTAGIVLALFVTIISAQAQTFTTLVNFDGTNGNGPNAPLVEGMCGDLYGTTWQGGANSQGTIFRVTLAGTFSVLYNFCALANCADGSVPLGALLQANGDLYGTAFTGGASNFGDVFKINPTTLTLTVLESFDYTDGEDPRGGLAIGRNGSFYGVTTAGGSDYNDGTIFTVTLDGTIAPLVTFNESGGYPLNAAVTLVLGNDGNFYGTTGASGSPYYSGTIFKVTPAGTYTVLHTFNGTTDGAEPQSGLLLGTDGNFYGTTPYEGANNNGVVFKITPAGTYTVLYAFDGTNGSAPYAALTLGSDGNFYGTTSAGGANGNGTIFKITPKGTVTDLYDFTSADGQSTVAGVTQATNGIFYGATYDGGTSGDGTVFSLNTGLPPFVSLAVTSAREGAAVGILGQGFSSSSVVEFGGVPATTVEPPGTTYLSATVPFGALTGPVTVTTGSTTLTSNRTFRVTPTLTSFTPLSGPVGTSVTINGTGLTQATYVKFNGESAVFSVQSDSEITATVPSDATTGKITVTTAGGTAVSTASFTVD